MLQKQKPKKTQTKDTLDEIEIFRITPICDRLYETASYTRKTGEIPNERYFTTHEPRFVGKFIKHCQIGSGNGAIHYDIFEKDGQRIRVDYSYDGTTCYREYIPLVHTGSFVVKPGETITLDFQDSYEPKPTCCIIM